MTIYYFLNRSNIPGAIIWGQLSDGGNFPRGQLSGEYLSVDAIIRGNHPGNNYPGGGGGNFPRRRLPGHHLLYVLSNILVQNMRYPFDNSELTWVGFKPILNQFSYLWHMIQTNFYVIEIRFLFNNSWYHLTVHPKSSSIFASETRKKTRYLSLSCNQEVQSGITWADVNRNNRLEVFCRKVFLKIWQNLQEKTCVRVCF